MEKFTRSDLKIKSYIEENSDEFLFMSIGQLAEKLGVSEATISRFVRHMGHSDFKEMKQDIMEQRSENGAARKLASTLLKNEGFDIKKWFEYQEDCLENTLMRTDLNEFSNAIVKLSSAEHIFIHAKNASSALGQLLYFRLRRLGMCVSCIPSGGLEIIEGVAHAGKKDVVITFGFSKLSRESKIILDYSKTAGYETILFTGKSHVSGKYAADVNIYVYRGEENEYHSMSSATAMIDALVIALSEKMQDKMADNLKKVESLKKKYREW